MTSVSPFKAANMDAIFDGGEYRFTVKASSFVIASMDASFKITGITCTNNENQVYELSSYTTLGYLTTKQSLEINRISVIDHDKYSMPDPRQNYVIQFYKPISELEYRGVSTAGRF